MKTQILSHNWTGKSLVMCIIKDGKASTKIVEESHPNWKQVERAYKQGDMDKVASLIDLRQSIATALSSRFSVAGDQIYFDNKPVHGFLFERIISFLKEGLPVKRLVTFAENLYANPSETARQELFKFLEHKNMPITDDGCFLGYKGVGKDYYSITGGSIQVTKGKVNSQGRIFNGVGETIRVKRDEVCNDVNIGCASGLHVGSWAYASDFKGAAGHMMVVKVNPQDVVSVPSDCQYQKLRTCAYEVIAEEGRQLSEVRDINFDKVAKVRRDALGRFCK